MKKHNLLKVMMCLLLLIMIVSYIIPGRSGSVTYIALGDVLINSMQSFYFFFDLAIFILLVGALYGVLNKTVSYKKFLDMIACKIKPNATKFLIGVIIVFALVTALTGISMPLFIFVPCVISIILLLGYDKLVALSSTIGAIVVGTIGSIFLNFRNSSSYTFAKTTLEEMLDIEKYGNIFPKIFLLALAIFLLVMYVLKHIKNVKEKKVDYALKDDADVMVTEVKGDYKNIKVWPIIVVFSLAFVFLVLGLVPWENLFGITIFKDFNTWLVSLAIGNFKIFPSIFLSELDKVPFGEFEYLGSYVLINVLIVVLILIVKFACKVKFDDMIEGIIDGFKKMLPTAILTTLAYSILICAYNNGFMETIINWASGLVGGFNLVVTYLLALLGSVFQVDLYYTVQGVFLPIMQAIEDSAVYPVLAVLFQSSYGIVMMIAPTSLILIAGLTYTNVPYSTWCKYIWRLVIELILVVLAIALILLLI